MMSYPPSPPLPDRLLATLFKKKWRGSYRLFKWVRGASPTAYLQITTQHGLPLYIQPTSYVDALTLQYGYYEEEVLQGILAGLGDEGVFWDVGANMGLHSLTVKHLRPRATVVSFEPAPLMQAQLLCNLHLTKLEITLFPFALSHERALGQLNVQEWWNPGITSLRAAGDIHYSRVLPCWCERGDELVQQGAAPSPTVLKMDVEGWEHEVLRGMTRILEGDTLRHIILEAPLAFLREQPASPLLAILHHHGFTVSHLPSSVEEQTTVTNFLAIR